MMKIYGLRCIRKLVYDSLHARIQKVLSEGSNFDNVFCCCFLVDEGREDANTTISGP